MADGFVKRPATPKADDARMKATPGPWRREGPDEFGDHNILHPADSLAVAAVVANLRPADEVEANATLIAQAWTIPTLRGLLNSLQMREQEYRKFHDQRGGDSIEAGRAWDRMKRCGDEARAALNPPTEESHD